MNGPIYLVMPFAGYCLAMIIHFHKMCENVKNKLNVFIIFALKSFKFHISFFQNLPQDIAICILAIQH